MSATPHLDKLDAALRNPKAQADAEVLQEAKELYQGWMTEVDSLTSVGKQRVVAMVNLLNRYKDALEVELIMKRGSPFLRRQKGQLKLDNSVIEEFLVQLVHPDILPVKGVDGFVFGPQNAFMSLSFQPGSLANLVERPEVIVKTKDQDFVVGAEVHYQMSSRKIFSKEHTKSGSFVLALIASECKINLDKTMFQEAAGTAARLKLGCTMAKYFLLVEYLDMTPEDPRLTDIDNVYLLRHARRLPFDRRSRVDEVERQHVEFPIDAEVVWLFVEELAAFLSASWFDSDEVLRRGAFV